MVFFSDDTGWSSNLLPSEANLSKLTSIPMKSSENLWFSDDLRGNRS